MDAGEELRAMDAAAADLQDGRPEKMLHLLTLKRQIHCYRCGVSYSKKDGKQTT